MSHKNQITFDVSGIIDSETLHETISKMLNFPGYYGMNWDAFDECIRDTTLPKTIIITHFDQLKKQLPRDAELLKECLQDFQKENPDTVNVKFC